MIKIVGTVTENEKLVIKEINDHKSALEELLIILPHDSDLYKQAMDLLEKRKAENYEILKSYGFDI